MSKNSKPQSVTMVGGRNVAPAEPVPKKSTKAETPQPEPEKTPEPEAPPEPSE